MPIDPLLSMLVAAIILRSAWRVVAASGHILLEGSPPGFDARAVKDDIRAALPYVIDVHHVHAWSISQERPMVTLPSFPPALIEPLVLFSARKSPAIFTNPRSPLVLMVPVNVLRAAAPPLP